MPEPQWADLASHYYCDWNGCIVGTFRDWHASQEPPVACWWPRSVSPRQQSPGPRLIQNGTASAAKAALRRAQRNDRGWQQAGVRPSPRL